MSTVREHLGLLWLLRRRLMTSNPQYNRHWELQAAQFLGVHLNDVITLAGGADVEAWVRKDFPGIPEDFPFAPSMQPAPATEQARTAQEIACKWANKISDGSVSMTRWLIEQAIADFATQAERVQSSESIDSPEFRAFMDKYDDEASYGSIKKARESLVAFIDARRATASKAEVPERTKAQFLAAERAGVSFSTQQKCWNAWFGPSTAEAVPESDAYPIADALYERGYRDAKNERDHDARGCEEWQSVVDAIVSGKAKPTPCSACGATGWHTCTPPAPYVVQTKEVREELRDTIGQAINDAVQVEGSDSIDWCDSREIDRIAEAVMAVLPATISGAA